MRKLQKIFGLVNKNERGFVILELIIGLPLILILLWSMNNLLINTWQKCKYAVADFILQQEMESAMQRIVEDARKARYFKPIDSGYQFSCYEIDDLGDFIFSHASQNLLKEINEQNIQDTEKAQLMTNPYKKDEPEYNEPEINIRRAIYIKSSGKIYRETNSNKPVNPITGDSVLSQTVVNKFTCKQKDEKSKILEITLEAMSINTKHKIKLKTEIYMRGLHNEE